MNKSPYVQYITCNYAELASIPKISGQLIALRDKDACYYDMMDSDNVIHRRGVSGVNIVYNTFSDDDRQPRNIYALVDSNDSSRPSGIYIWEPNGQYNEQTLQVQLSLKNVSQFYTTQLSESSPNLQPTILPNRWKSTSQGDEYILQDVSSPIRPLNSDDMTINLCALCYDSAQLPEFELSFEYKNSYLGNDLLYGAIFGMYPGLDDDGNMVSWMNTTHKGSLPAPDSGLWFKPCDIHDVKVAGTFVQNGTVQSGKSITIINESIDLDNDSWHKVLISVTLGTNKNKHISLTIDNVVVLELETDSSYYSGERLFVGSNNHGVQYKNIHIEYVKLIEQGDYICLASVNTDENVKIQVAQDRYYLTGTYSSQDNTGHLVMNPNLYVDASGNLVVPKIIGSIDSANSDSKNQPITDYIFDILTENNKLKIVQGSGKSKLMSIPQDETHAYVGNTSESAKNEQSKNGQVHINLFDSNTLRNSIQMSGQSGTSVTSDDKGHIYIESEGTVPNTATDSGYVKKPGENMSNKVWGLNESGQPDWIDFKEKMNIVPGQYTQVTVNEYGQVISGSNPASMSIRPLDRNDNLNDIIEPGYYVAPADNSIKNKPEDINSFCLQVIPTSLSSGYVKQIIEGSGEHFLTHNFIDITISKISLLTDNNQRVLQITLSHSDYPEELTELYFPKLEKYNFLDNILLYTCSISDDSQQPQDVITLREALADNSVHVQYSDTNHTLAMSLSSDLFTDNQGLMKVHVPKYTVLPSYEYCNNSAETQQTGFKVASGSTGVISTDNSITLYSDNYSLFSESNYSYIRNCTTVYSISTTVTDYNTQPSIALQLASQPELMYINGHETSEGIQTDNVICYVPLTKLVRYTNDIRIVCEDGNTYQVFIINSEGTSDSYPEGESSTDTYTRICTPVQYSAWTTTYVVSWSRYQPE